MIELLKNGSIGNPNLLINGDFQVWQRGENLSGSEVANGKYCADRWRVYNTSNSSLIIKKVSNGISFENVTSYMNISQPFEDSFFEKYGVKEYTLTKCINGVETITHGTIPTTNTNFVAVGFDKDCIVNYVKLEIGSIATPFVPRPYAEELLLCQRYYYRLEPGSDGKDLIVSIGSHISNICLFTFILPTILRVAPSVKYSNVKTHNSYGLHDVSEITLAHSQASSNITALNVTTSNKASTFTIIHLRVVTGGYLAFDAEIY